jgi:hypothetical protein
MRHKTFQVFTVSLGDPGLGATTCLSPEMKALYEGSTAVEVLPIRGDTSDSLQRTEEEATMDIGSQ